MTATTEGNRGSLWETLRMREHMVDGAKASPVVAYIGAWLGGVSISDWATFAAFVYTTILIIDKLKTMGVFRRVGQWLHRHRKA